MGKICELSGVREYAEGFPVSLWMDADSGRLVIVAENEAGNNATAVDLLDLVRWLTSGPLRGAYDGGADTVTIALPREGGGGGS